MKVVEGVTGIGNSCPHFLPLELLVDLIIGPDGFHRPEPTAAGIINWKSEAFSYRPANITDN